MAMRNYGVESKCMVLTFDEFYHLCIIKRVGIDEKTSELFKGFYDENNVPLDFSKIDYSDLLDITYNIDFATYFSEFDGSFTKMNTNETKYFNGENLIIIEPKKYATLFECYKDYDEIYTEIMEDLMGVGIKVDKEYIKEHFGEFEGSYYA